jgi:hypothetical protein
MHQHCRGIALQIPQLAVGYGGIGKNGIAVLTGLAGLAQAESQVFYQLGKMSSALIIAEGEGGSVHCFVSHASTFSKLTKSS